MTQRGLIQPVIPNGQPVMMQPSMVQPSMVQSVGPDGQSMIMQPAQVVPDFHPVMMQQPDMMQPGILTFQLLIRNT